MGRHARHASYPFKVYPATKQAVFTRAHGTAADAVRCNGSDPSPGANIGVEKPKRIYAMKKLLLAATLVAVAAPVAPVLGDPPPWAPAHGRRAKEASRMYDQYGRYYEPHRLDRNDYVWRGRDGRYYCRRDNGTTGLIVGAAVGALVGRSLDGGRDRTLGTILGAAGGGLLGREIDRGNLRCR